MKLLFLLDGVYAPGGPTVRFGRAMAHELVALGNNVTLLENVPDAAEDYTDDDGVPHIPFYDDTERALYRQVAQWRAEGMAGAGLALKLLARPRLLWVAVRLYLLKRGPLEASFRWRLEALCREEGFDAAVSVSAPHYTALALAGAAFGGVKAAYMVDPYASAATLRHVASRRREQWLYKKLDVAFITQVMEKNGLYPTRYAQKAMALPFPNVRPLVRQAVEDDVALDDEYVNCVFVGNLYLDIRSPAFAVALFARLPEKYRLVLVGDGFEQFPKALRQAWRAALGKRLLVHPPVSQEAAANLMQAADVLVSIGNSDASQLPSKVFDYVSTGLPVLSLCKLDDCPTRPVLDAYPLACTLREAEVVSDEQVARVAAFLEENIGRRLPFEEVERLYRAHTPGAVAAQMNAALQKAVAHKDHGVDT